MHVHAPGAFCQEECLQRHSDSHRARVASEALRNPLGYPEAAQPWSQGLLRQWTARRGPVLSRSDSSLNKWPRSGRVSVFSRPQQPSEVRGLHALEGRPGGHPGWLWLRARGFLAPLVFHPPLPAQRLFSLPDPVCIFLCHQCLFYVFSGPLSSISSINTSRSGQDK